MAPEPLRALFDALPVTVCVHRDGRVLHANAAFAMALGRTDVSALRNQLIEELVHDDDRALIIARSAGPANDDATFPAADLRWRRSDGETFAMQTYAARMPFEGGAATVELGPPLTPSSAFTPSFGNQLAAVGSLAAGVAHEINNPLTYVLANLDSLREQLRAYSNKLPSAVFDEMDTIAAEAKTGAERIARIVHGLKIFSRVEEEQREPVELHAIVDAACALASNEIRHRARLMKIYRPLHRVEASEARLTLVFYNLFLNAAQAIVEGRAEENQIQVKTWNDHDRAVVEIRDSGNGIAAEHLPRIFDPFFTTKPIGWGTGLGLSMCHGIIASLGGEITVETTVGVGTAFRVAIPAYTGVSVPPVPVTHISSSSDRSGKILVVDDDAAICTAIQRTLGRRHKVTTTTNGREVIELLNSGERFDLILCDLMMPMVTGMEIYAEVKRLVPEQAERMVFMTGGAFTAAARDFLRDVPNERFEKPFDGGSLRMLAKEMVLEAPPRSPGRTSEVPPK